MRFIEFIFVKVYRLALQVVAAINNILVLRKSSFPKRREEVKTFVDPYGIIGTSISVAPSL